ncbi:TPA: hypothetical protein ACX6NV_000552 [Photobacterium damselae]
MIGNIEKLNRKLAQLLGYEIDEQGTEAMNRFITAANGVYDGRLKLTNGEWFNPCEDWGDIMPIAVKFRGVHLYKFAGEPSAAIIYKNDHDEISETCFRDDNQKKALTRCCINALENHTEHNQ